MATLVSMGVVCFCFLLMVAAGRELPACPHDFVTAAICSRTGDLWVATEGGGLLVLPQGASRWEKKKGNGLPETDNFLSLAEDHLGRIWAGTDNQGVAVWNGESWAHYDQRNALLGERVGSMAVSPLNGDVAIATSGGLTVYSPSTGTWRDLMRADGLPEDHAVSVSFNEKGGLWAAFLTNGIGYAVPGAQYGDWKLVQTKWYWDKEQRVRQPLEPRGKGLPSNFNNAICAEKGSVWVGTISGLGYGKGLSDWKFLRGRDYEQKNEGLWLDKEHKTRKPGKIVPAADTSLLPEDYVTCFYPVPGGMWMGFRGAGVCFVRESSLLIREVELETTGDEKEFIYATCFVTLPDGTLYVGTYGHGLMPVERTVFRRSAMAAGKALPAHPRPPVISREWEEAPVPAGKGQVPDQKEFTSCYWYEDWATQGDWCERYGRSYAVLCAANAPIDNVAIFSDHSYACTPVRGPHANEAWMKGSVVYVNEPEMRNILYCPESTTRTLALWSDGGDDYPLTFDGPDLGVIATVPEGRHLLSLYFYDPTPLVEHQLRNSLRDYLIEVRKMPPDFSMDVVEGKGTLQKGQQPLQYLMDALTSITGAPVESRSRVKSFAGNGVYKNFILNGQGDYYVRLVRNYSTGATVNGIFLSSLDEGKKAWTRYRNEGKVSTVYGLKTPGPPPLNREDLRQLPRALLTLWGQSQDVGKQGLAGIYDSRRQGIGAYRRLSLLAGLEDVKANWRWRLNIWEDVDKEDFRKQVADAWESLQDRFSFYRSDEWSHYAPETTVPFSIEEVKKMESRNIDWKQYRSGSFIKPKMSVQEMKKWLKEH